MAKTTVDELVEVKRRKVETDLSINEVDRYKTELEAVIANANLKAESDKKEIDGYKRELEAVTAKFMYENSSLSEKLKRSRTEIDGYKVERDKSTAAFKDVITLKNAKIRQLENELVKVQTESAVYQEKVKSMVDAESTNGVVALQLQLQKFKTESEFRQNEIGRYKKELEDMATKMKTESEDLNNSLQMERVKIRQLEFELVKFKTESAVYQRELSSKTIAETNGVIAVQKKIMGMLERKGEENSDVRSSFSSLTSETTIRARFNDISKLNGEYVYSQPSRYCGIDWWSCSVFAEVQLISHLSEEIVHCADLNAVFSDDSSMWGTDFISFKDLVNRENGYVKDDSIIIAVSFRAFPSN